MTQKNTADEAIYDLYQSRYERLIQLIRAKRLMDKGEIIHKPSVNHGSI